MKKQEEPKIVDIKTFKEALQPFITAREELRQKLDGLTKSIAELRGQAEAKQKKLATFVDDMSHDLSSGKLLSEKDIGLGRDLKSDIENLQSILDILEAGSLPEVRLDLQRAENLLIEKIKTLCEPLKEVYQKKVETSIQAGIDEGMAFIGFIDKLLGDLNLKLVIPWLEQRSICKLSAQVSLGPEGSAFKELLEVKGL